MTKTCAQNKILTNPRPNPHTARVSFTLTMPVERWYQARRKFVLLFLAVTLIPALGLVWLTIELVEKDRRLERQHAQERVGRLADKVVAASHQRLSNLERELHRLAAGDQGGPPDYTVLLVAEGDRVAAAPTVALVYYPILPQTSQSLRNVFGEGERYEHHEGDLRKAISFFSALARSDDPAIRAGALLRLARNQGKAGQVDGALATFEALEEFGPTQVEGFPAGLLALEGRCGLLEKSGRLTELKTAAKALRSGLASGTWPLLQSAYDFYMEGRYGRERMGVMLYERADTPGTEMENKHPQAIRALPSLRRRDTEDPEYLARRERWSDQRGISLCQWSRS